MIKINKVKSLKNGLGKVKYSELKEGEVFILFDDGELRYMTKNGHVNFRNKSFSKRDDMSGYDVAKIVDAEINWAYKEGE